MDTRTQKRNKRRKDKRAQKKLPQSPKVQGLESEGSMVSDLDPILDLGSEPEPASSETQTNTMEGTKALIQDNVSDNDNLGTKPNNDPKTETGGMGGDGEDVETGEDEDENVDVDPEPETETETETETGVNADVDAEIEIGMNAKVNKDGIESTEDLGLTMGPVSKGSTEPLWQLTYSDDLGPLTQTQTQTQTQTLTQDHEITGSRDNSNVGPSEDLHIDQRDQISDSETDETDLANESKNNTINNITNATDDLFDDNSDISPESIYSYALPFIGATIATGILMVGYFFLKR